MAMNKDLRRILTVAGALVGVTLLAAFLYTGHREAEQSRTVEAVAAADASVFVRPHSRILGPMDAEVTVVEFFDPECEACRAVYPMVKRLLAEHPDDVRLVLRYMPLHGNAAYAASVLEAAGEQGRYWDMLETLLRHQPEWGSHHAPRPELIPQYAEQIGLDVQAIEEAVKSGRYRELVEIDHRDGIALGVRQTPTFFVNGKRLDQLGYAPLKAMIEQELAAARAR